MSLIETITEHLITIGLRIWALFNKLLYCSDSDLLKSRIYIFSPATEQIIKLKCLDQTAIIILCVIVLGISVFLALTLCCIRQRYRKRVKKRRRPACARSNSFRNSFFPTPVVRYADEISNNMELYSTSPAMNTMVTFSRLPESRAKPFQYLQEIEEDDEDFGDDISRLTSFSNMSRLNRARYNSSSTIRLCDSNIPSRNNSMLRLDSNSTMHTVVLNQATGEII